MRRSIASVPRCGGLLAVAALPLSLNACAAANHHVEKQAPSPPFDPVAFFAGATTGIGSLKIMTKRAQRTEVTGHGRVTPDGGIILDQDVRRGTAPVKHRRWDLHRVGLNRYAGTLTDAAGPVRGEVIGNCLHLAFKMKGGLKAQQWLYLRPGGQTAQNRMVVTKFGLPVASLDETIRRMPA